MPPWLPGRLRGAGWAQACASRARTRTPGRQSQDRGSSLLLPSACDRMCREKSPVWRKRRAPRQADWPEGCTCGRGGGVSHRETRPAWTRRPGGGERPTAAPCAAPRRLLHLSEPQLRSLESATSPSLPGRSGVQAVVGSTGASRSAGGEAGSLPRAGGVEGDSQSQGFAGERAPGHLGRDQRAGAAQRPACAARREQA